MDMGPSERINPDILKWARETAGLSLAEAAEKLGLKDTAKATAVEKLHKLETGERRPRPNFLAEGRGGLPPPPHYVLPASAA